MAKKLPKPIEVKSKTSKGKVFDHKIKVKASGVGKRRKPTKMVDVIGKSGKEKAKMRKAAQSTIRRPKKPTAAQTIKRITSVKPRTGTSQRNPKR